MTNLKYIEDRSNLYALALKKDHVPFQAIIRFLQPQLRTFPLVHIH